MIKLLTECYILANCLEKIDQILTQFEPITLKEMDGVALLNRVDTKFITDIDTLASVLEEVSNDYRVLQIENLRKNSYETLYYDTPELLFYHSHHRGKVNRYKFRKRKYVESDLSFLEIKFKNNKKRTIKNRMEIDGIEMDMNDESMDYVKDISEMELNLQPMLLNRFSRITLVNKTHPERLTIDLNLSFDDNGEVIALNKLVIVEAKQEKIWRGTAFLKALKKRLVRKSRISKYCLGMALTRKDLKQNNFKQRIKKINRIENGTAA